MTTNNLEHKHKALQRLILDLREASRENDAPIWRTVADTLSAPTRDRPTVNLHDLNDHDADILIVPGKVLGGGILHDDVRVAAYKFSGSAETAVDEALTLRDAIDEADNDTSLKIIT